MLGAGVKHSSDGWRCGITGGLSLPSARPSLQVRFSSRAPFRPTEAALGQSAGVPTPRPWKRAPRGHRHSARHSSLTVSRPSPRPGRMQTGSVPTVPQGRRQLRRATQGLRNKGVRQLPANPRPRSLDRRGSVRALAHGEASGGLPRPGSGPQPALPRPLPPVCDRTSMLSFPLSKVSFKILPLCVAFYAKVV